jgi:fatty acid desaturase
LNSIRSELSELIVGVFRSRDSIPAGLFCIFRTLFFAAVGAGAAEFLTSIFPDFSWTFRSVAIFWIGTRMRALGNMMHECSHGTFVGNASANSHFGHLLAALDLSSFSDYARQHTTHHAYLGDPERDLDLRDRFFLLNRGRKWGSVASLFLLALSTVPVWILMLRPVFWASKAPRWSNYTRVFVLCSVALGLFYSTTRLTIFTYVLLPYLTTYQWMRLLSDACDHIFLTTHKEMLERSRNHLFKADWMNRLLFPRHDGYHLLHHLFPSLPTRVFPVAHRQLMAHPWYRERNHFVKFAVMNSSKELCEIELIQGQSK